MAVDLATPIPVLDAGYVRYIRHQGTDADIVADARQSTDGQFRGWEQDAAFLAFLYREGHLTPFEGCALTVEAQAPLMVVRQWQRHRTQSFNEASGRYGPLPDAYYEPTPSRWADPGPRRAGQPPANPDPTQCAQTLRQAYAHADAATHALRTRAAPELARLATPLGRYTRLRATAHLRNWLHFLDLRLRPDAQWETQQYARAIAAIIQTLWPRAYAAFEEYTLHAARLSRTERTLLASLLDRQRLADAAAQAGLPPARIRALLATFWPEATP